MIFFLLLESREKMKSIVFLSLITILHTMIFSFSFHNEENIFARWRVSWILDSVKYFFSTRTRRRYFPWKRTWRSSGREKFNLINFVICLSRSDWCFIKSQSIIDAFLSLLIKLNSSFVNSDKLTVDSFFMAEPLTPLRICCKIIRCYNIDMERNFWNDNIIVNDNRYQHICNQKLPTLICPF